MKERKKDILTSLKMVGSNLVTVFPCFTSSSSPRWGTTTGIDFDKCGDTTDSNFFRIIAPPVRLAGKGKNFNLHYLRILRTSKFKEKKLWISRYILLTDHFMNLDYNILRLGDKIVSFKPCSSPFKVWYGSITQFLFEIEALAYKHWCILYYKVFPVVYKLIPYATLLTQSTNYHVWAWHKF